MPWTPILCLQDLHLEVFCAKRYLKVDVSKMESLMSSLKGSIVPPPLLHKSNSWSCSGQNPWCHLTSLFFMLLISHPPSKLKILYPRDQTFSIDHPSLVSLKPSPSLSLNHDTVPIQLVSALALLQFIFNRTSQSHLFKNTDLNMSHLSSGFLVSSSLIKNNKVLNNICDHLSVESKI